MSKQEQIELPCPAEIKATGEVLIAQRRSVIAGIGCFALYTTGGRFVGDYRRDSVILRPA